MWRNNLDLTTAFGDSKTANKKPQMLILYSQKLNQFLDCFPDICSKWIFESGAQICVAQQDCVQQRGVIINPIVNDRPSISRKEPRLGPKNAFSISSGILKGFGDVPEQQEDKLWDPIVSMVPRKWYVYLIDKSNVFTKAARKVSRDNFITHS